MIDQNGKPEAGEYNGGVLRDALTEFWNEFYLRYTLGSDSKIPVVTHTLDENSWKSTGKIIVFGYNQVGYFPVQIFRPFITKCITGSEGCSNGELQNSFLNSMNSTDRDDIKNDLNGAFVLDDVIDALETYDVKTIITQENVNNVILQTAHKEIIQKPSFIYECWKDTLQMI